MGLQPELRVEDDAVSPIFFDEPETAKPETVRQKFPDAYKDTDFTGITLPIYVDGFYRGYVLSYVVIRRNTELPKMERHRKTRPRKEKKAKHRRSRRSDLAFLWF